MSFSCYYRLGETFFELSSQGTKGASGTPGVAILAAGFNRSVIHAVADTVMNKISSAAEAFLIISAEQLVFQVINFTFHDVFRLVKKS